MIPDNPLALSLRPSIRESIRSFYERLFSIQEILSSRRLQGIHYSLILGFFFLLGDLRNHPIGTLSQLRDLSFTCPEYLRSCDRFFFLDTVPKSYSYDLSLAIVFALLVASAACGLLKRWAWAHFLLIPVFFFGFFLEFFLNGTPSVPLVGFTIFSCVPFLFCKNKLSGLRLLFAVMYILAGFVKLHEGWISGSYFSSLGLGLPLVPTNLIPFFTHLVILMELGGVWLLFSRSARWKNLALGFFVLFHLYSFVFVGYRFPLLCLPLLFFLYAGRPRVDKAPALGTVALIFSLLALNGRHFLYDGDSKATLEGVSLAFSMVDANRQTISTEREYLRGGAIRESGVASQNAFDRNKPYARWFRIQQRCKLPEVERVEWVMDVSLNGEPFRRIIRERDACGLSYDSFRHNSWIHSDGEVIGYPGSNFYSEPGRSREIRPLIHAEPKIQASPLETWLKERSQVIGVIYGIFALIAALVRFFL